MTAARTTTTLRLRRIRYKDGRTLDVLRPPVTDGPRKSLAVKSRVAEVLAAQGNDIAGFAFVVWASSGASCAKMYCGHGSFPSSYAPDFVRNRLLAEDIINWTTDILE
jgi:hypothetical protein